MSNERTFGDSSCYELYTRSLAGEYDTIKRLGVGLLTEKGIPEAPVDASRDTRRSLDVYFPATTDLQKAVDSKILKPANKLFEDLGAPQVIYPPQALHLSIFVIFAAETPDEIKPTFDRIPQYYDATYEALLTCEPVEINFNRVLISPAGIILGGTPKSLGIQRIRARLYQQFEKYNLPYNYRRPPFINHITCVRWKAPLSPSQTAPIIEFADGLDGQEIWKGTLDNVGFGIGSYNPEKLLVIDQFKLTPKSE